MKAPPNLSRPTRKGLGWATNWRRGVEVFFITFTFADKDGIHRRFRRKAHVQSPSGAAAEAKRLMLLAAQTGSPYGEEQPLKPEPQEPPKPRVPTFREFGEGYYERVWLANPANVTPATRVRYLALLDQILDRFGDTPLDGLTRAAWELYEAELRTRVRPLGEKRTRHGKRAAQGKRTGVQVRPYTNFVRSFLARAVEAEIIPESAIPKLKAPKASGTLPTCPSDLEARAWIAHEPTSWIHLGVMVSLYAAMRQGELRASRRKDWDLENLVVYVRRALSEDAEGVTKGKRERAVAIHPALAEYMAPKLRLMLPEAPIFVDDDGEMPSRQNVLYAFYRHCAGAGTARWSWHSLRHYALTALCRAGAPTLSVQAIGGHADLKTTQRYLHAAASDLTAAVARLPRL